MSEENRVPLTVRLRPRDKQTFSDAAHAAGLEPSIAGRQIIELVTRRIEAGADFIDTLQALKVALKPTVRVQAGRS